MIKDALIMAGFGMGFMAAGALFILVFDVLAGMFR